MRRRTTNHSTQHAGSYGHLPTREDISVRMIRLRGVDDGADKRACALCAPRCRQSNLKSLRACEQREAPERRRLSDAVRF